MDRDKLYLLALYKKTDPLRQNWKTTLKKTFVSFEEYRILGQFLAQNSDFDDENPVIFEFFEFLPTSMSSKKNSAEPISIIFYFLKTSRCASFISAIFGGIEQD